MRFRNITLILLLGNLTFASSIKYINSIRANSGASTLKFSSKLAYAAKKHATYLAKNREFGHNESSIKDSFYAAKPWLRIVKAGYETKAVVENITFYEPSFKASIEKLMSTVYHRLAFLDTKVDTIGYARYKGVYVYDMSNSKIASLCKSAKRVGDIANICKNSKLYLSRSSFRRALKQTKRRSRDIIYYPYNNQRNVGVKLAVETPSFIANSSRYGYPITIHFNSAIYTNVRLKEFKLFNNGKAVAGKVVTFRNDMRKKLDKNSFVFLPKRHLKHKTRYKVLFSATANGKPSKLTWSFTTK
jgi:hypothetical protein